MAAPMETKFRHWWTWDYEKEVKWINEWSRQGLQFRRAGFLRSSFERNADDRYTYSLDFQQGLGKGDKLREYKELYREAGWEYVATYAGMWHYFRRPWEPGETLALYSDRESLAQHYRTIRRMMGTMLLLNLAILLLNMANLLPRYGDRLWSIVIPVATIYAVLFGLLGYGYARMGRKIKQVKGR
ncbi:DUF2812 domain-containing protein [Paenibacillus cymbidii]|uniref:DUF2812 domain-containing protein n=1 Tax=Paenibacillus cymbidii TaxID=1639034 RepID=UPI0010814FA2|nr:DUF2812 domain-containing protein [Paenibacillus cymbidii]